MSLNLAEEFTALNARNKLVPFEIGLHSLLFSVDFHTLGTINDLDLQGNEAVTTDIQSAVVALELAQLRHGLAIE